MAIKPETKIVNDICKYLKKLQKDGQAVWFLKLHGSAFQRAGVPDLVVVVGQETTWIEVKTSDGKLSKIQEHEHRKMHVAGAAVYVVTSLDQFKWCVWDYPI